MTIPKGVRDSIAILAGLGFLLYSAGYIIEFAHHSLLGVIILDPTKTSYLWSGSNFFINTIQMAGQHLISMPLGEWSVVVGWSVVVAAVALAGWLAVRRFSSRRAMQTEVVRWRYYSLVVAVLIVLLFKLWWFELPAAHIDGVIGRSFSPRIPPPANFLFKSQVDRFWESLVCARISAANLDECGDSAKATENLRGSYLLNALAAVVLLLLSVSLYRSAASRARGTERRSRAGVWLAVVVPMLGIVGTLFFYGRLIRNLDPSREVIVDYSSSGQLEGLLLDDSLGDERLRVLDEDTLEIWTVPLPAVAGLRHRGHRDVWRVRREDESEFEGIEVAGWDGFMLELETLQKRRVRRSDTIEASRELKEVMVDYRGTRHDEYHGYVLAETDGFIYLFEKESGEIWELDRDHIRLMKVERLSDALDFHVRARR